MIIQKQSYDPKIKASQGLAYKVNADGKTWDWDLATIARSSFRKPLMAILSQALAIWHLLIAIL